MFEIIKLLNDILFFLETRCDVSLQNFKPHYLWLIPKIYAKLINY